MFDDLLEILGSLKRNKMRTMLTGLSVSMGIFLLIIVLSAGNGLIHAVEFNTSGMALDVVEVWPGQTSEPYDGLEANREVKFDNRDIELIKQHFPEEVVSVSASLSQYDVNLHHNNKSTTLELNGCYPEEGVIQKLVITSGRFINATDVSNRRKSIVVSSKTAAEFYPNAADMIGKSVRLDSIIYTVVGIYSDKGRFGNATAYIPFTTLQSIYNRGTELSQLTLQTRGIAEEGPDTTFKNKLRSTLAAQHRFSPNDRNAIWMWNTSIGARETDNMMNILRISLWIVGLLTLLSGIVGISNIMLITVKERTHEFGIRKALGAKSWRILRSVMLESILITFIFGYIGLLCGILASEYMNIKAGETVITMGDQSMYTFLNPTIDLDIAIEALIVLIIAGLLAGFFPARKAVKVKPIEALRAK